MYVHVCISTYKHIHICVSIYTYTYICMYTLTHFLKLQQSCYLRLTRFPISLAKIAISKKFKHYRKIKG